MRTYRKKNFLAHSNIYGYVYQLISELYVNMYSLSMKQSSRRTVSKTKYFTNLKNAVNYFCG